MDDTDNCSSEQYFRCSKALGNKDYVAAAQIIDTSEPVTMKHLENNITVSGDWAKQAPVIMETGVRTSMQPKSRNNCHFIRYRYQNIPRT
jgi:predicted NAD-dependent protein-ADP-ribosyltransferase YbiA (DUF1768 family)